MLPRVSAWKLAEVACNAGTNLRLEVTGCHNGSTRLGTRLGPKSFAQAMLVQLVGDLAILIAFALHASV